jgi:hypothetical protein
MIDQYLNLFEAIRQKSAEFGKQIIQYGHYATRRVKIPVARPFFSLATRTGVRIIIGSEGSGERVYVTVPAEFFDVGYTIDIQAWVKAQNTEFGRSIGDAVEAEKLARRQQELTFLKELAEKYPQEAAILLENGKIDG